MIRSALQRLANGTVIYGVGGVLQKFMGLLLLPFYTRVLTTEDYGVVSLISLFGVAMNGFLTLGTGNSMGYLYFREEDRAKRPIIIWTNLFLLAGNGIFWFSLVWLFAPAISSFVFRTNQYGNLIYLAVLTNVLISISDPWRSYLRMEEKAKQFVFVTLFSSLLTIGLSILLVLFLNAGVFGLILAGTLAQLISLVFMWFIVGRKLPFGVDKKLISPLIRIGFPSTFGIFAFLVIDYADRHMIERMLGLSELGIYSTGYSFGMIMTILMGAFATAWPPFFMSYVNKQAEAGRIFGRVMTYYTLGFGSLIVLVFFAAKPLVMSMTAATFHESWVVVGLVATGFALKGWYLITLPGISFARKLHWQSIIEWIAAISNIGLNFWLIPIYGILGAAMATAISYLTLPVVAWLVSRKFLTVLYQWDRLALSSTAVATASGLIFYFSGSYVGWSYYGLISNFIVVLAFFAFCYSTLLSDRERAMIKDKLGV